MQNSFGIFDFDANSVRSILLKETENSYNLPNIKKSSSFFMVCFSQSFSSNVHYFSYSNKNKNESKIFNTNFNNNEINKKKVEILKNMPNFKKMIISSKKMKTIPKVLLKSKDCKISNLKIQKKTIIYNSLNYLKNLAKSLRGKVILTPKGSSENNITDCSMGPLKKNENINKNNENYLNRPHIIKNFDYWTEEPTKKRHLYSGILTPSSKNFVNPIDEINTAFKYIHIQRCPSNEELNE